MIIKKPPSILFVTHVESTALEFKLETGGKLGILCWQCQEMSKKVPQIATKATY